MSLLAPEKYVDGEQSSIIAMSSIFIYFVKLACRYSQHTVYPRYRYRIHSILWVREESFRGAIIRPSVIIISPHRWETSSAELTMHERIGAMAIELRPIQFHLGVDRSHRFVVHETLAFMLYARTCLFRSWTAVDHYSVSQRIDSPGNLQFTEVKPLVVVLNHSD